MAPGDIRNHDVDTGPIRQRCVDKRLAEVDPSPGGMQHPLDEITHLFVGQTDREPFGYTSSSRKDPVGRVDPDLLHPRVIQIRLQHPEPRDLGQGAPHAGHFILDQRKTAGQGDIVVPPHLGEREPVSRLRITGWVDPLGSKSVAHASSHCRLREPPLREPPLREPNRVGSAQRVSGSGVSGCGARGDRHPGILARCPRRHPELSTDAPGRGRCAPTTPSGLTDRRPIVGIEEWIPSPCSASSSEWGS